MTDGGALGRGRLRGAHDDRRGAGRLWSLAVGGALALFAVQPPLDLWPLAWLAPLPWLTLVREPVLPGRRPWSALWAAGFIHWLLAVHWLRLPHPATSIGWVALSAYLAGYVPAFIWLARRLVHRWRWPLPAAAALAWMTAELVRGTVLGGFTFAALGHTQWRWTMLVQCADVGGAVLVGGVVMVVAAAVLEAVRSAAGGLRRAAVLAATTAAVPAAALGYGAWRLATAPPPSGPALDVLLVQGSIDTELKHDPDAAADVARHYDELTIAGLAGAGRRPDVVIWPETMWRWGLLEIDVGETIADAVVDEMLGPAPVPGDERQRSDRQARCREKLERQRLDALAAYARRYGTTWIVGLDKQRITPAVPGGVQNFNCALFVDASGAPLACYEKMHPVMFGEYVPWGDRLPWLYRLTPLSGGLTAGSAPVAVEIAGRWVAATICYETTLPGAVRALVNTLARDGRRPDVIANLTNDGWFWGSSELDMHLTAAVFRAIEVRTPLVVAANTGFSAAIDGCGRVLARGPRRETATLRVAVHPDGRASPWLVWGNLPVAGCGAVATAVLAEALAGRTRRRRDRHDRTGRGEPS